jgi:hypothetical protein
MASIFFRSVPMNRAASLARLLSTGLWLVATAASLMAAEPTADQIEFFEKKIRPVLVRECYECHAADSKVLQAGLRLDNRESLIKGGDGGPVVVPGNAEESELIAALKYESTEMPPKGRLPDDVIADFEHWINQGAADPRDGTATAAPTIDVEKGRQFWAFVPPRAHPRPAVRDAAWPQREHDWFVRAAQEAKGLAPVGPASREAWLRRVTFDLIGLPPSIAEIDAFLADGSPEACAKVVDRLLAAESFGEQWARHWLDVARYTDDFGGTVGPVPAATAYRYRDWVVAAFNADMPYDQFVRLQLAGDLLAEPTDDHVVRLAGLGFQGLGQKFSTNAVGMAKKKVADELDDRIDTVTRGLLGLTVSCARCHDHKFDPISTRDYYALGAAYNGSAWNAELPLAAPEAVKAFDDWSKASAEIEARLKKVQADEVGRLVRAEYRNVARYMDAVWEARALAAANKSVDLAALAERHAIKRSILEIWQKTVSGKAVPGVLAAWQAAVDAGLAAVAGGGDAVKEGLVEPPAAVVEASRKVVEQSLAALDDMERFERETAAKQEKPAPVTAENQEWLKVFLNKDPLFRLGVEEAKPFFTPEVQRRLAELRDEAEAHKKAAPPAPPKVFAVTGGGAAMQINVRGNADQLGDLVPPGFLQVLSAPQTPPVSIAAGQKTQLPTFTRLDLAAAVATPANPLTARVYVNRVWHHLFGRGIVGTLSNFGQLGDRPTHPELLDTLAVRFIEAGWSTKWLVREIVLSATYGLASDAEAEGLELDPDNLLLWRMTPRRLGFEAWRDGMLAVAGKLDATRGGPPFTDGVIPKKDDGKTQLHPENPAHGRRTIYSFVSRFQPNPTGTLFDVPEPNVTSEQRTQTTIPQQQLFALNSPFVVAMAQAFAERVGRDAADDEGRVRLAWRLAYGRSPAPSEVAATLEYLQTVDRDWSRVCHALFMSNEFAFLP